NVKLGSPSRSPLEVSGPPVTAVVRSPSVSRYTDAPSLSPCSGCLQHGGHVVLKLLFLRSPPCKEFDPQSGTIMMRVEACF
ncbi:hypothetical protein JZ751_004900, partial [Albula glossodonta]